MPDVTLEIEGMRKALLAKSDSELADMLGVGRSAISQWRKRGAVPDQARARFEIAREHNEFYRGATAKVADLSGIELARARALAIAYAHRYASAMGEGRHEDRLLSMAGAFDQLTVAAAILLREEAKASGLGLDWAYEHLLMPENLQSQMTDVLLPKLLGERLHGP